jgi:hypothetical protein
MTIRTARWTLWLGMMVMLPVPFFLAETGLVPPARILMLGVISLAVWVVEGAAGVVRITTALLLMQTAGYGGLLWIIATVAARMVRRLSPPTLRRITVATLAVGVLCTASFKVYRDPFRAHALYASLLQVYE